MANVIINDTHLTNIADAIREKTGTSDTYKPGEMATAIAAIEAGGGGGDLPEEAFKLTGECVYRFGYGGWDWFIENYGDKITTENISNASYMFYFSNVEEIPFDLNFDNKLNYVLASNMFDGCHYLTNIPKLIGLKPDANTRIFAGCQRLREISAESLENIDFSYMDNLNSEWSGNRSYLFNTCFSLRSLPMEFLNHGNPKVYYTYSIYYCGFTSCHTLDEIINLPLPHIKSEWSSNTFSDTFHGCNRLKNMTFALQEDGTPYVVKWKNQTIDLTNSGYNHLGSKNYILDYNSGITADKEVKDDATYQALKDDPDWFTSNVAYSRYNHDSAVATINSLPDTSAYGTNTIKFKGAAGSATDGGAINTLTDEEIAVATVKGWTVSLV